MNQEVVPVPMNLVAPAEEHWNHPVPVLGKNSEGRAIRQVELLSNKLLTIAFEVSLGCVTVIRRAKRRQRDSRDSYRAPKY